ncbi:glycosyltransferase [Chloroflexota bacterium]
MPEHKNGKNRNPSVTEFLSRNDHQFRKTEALVYIPAYDEEDTIADIITRIRQICGFDILVIDDGSNDKTPEILKTLDVDILRRVNGWGSRIIDGLEVGYALGYSYVIKIDGDGQHDPHDIQRLYELATSTGTDIVIGSRHLKQFTGSKTWVAGQGMRFCSALVKFILKQRVTDTTSGLKIWNHHACEVSIQAFRNGKLKQGSTYHVEELIIAARNGLKIKEVDVVMHPREFGESKSFNRKELFIFPLQLLRSTFRALT